MFKQNNRHQQPDLVSNVDDLPEKHQKRLETSWAGGFCRETYNRLDERPFGVRYAEILSRSNLPVIRIFSKDWYAQESLYGPVLSD